MWCSSYKARLKLQHSQKSKRKTTRTQVFGSTICPHAAPSFHSTLPKLHKNSLQSERSLAANIYIDARPLIRLMYSCEILILPHDGTTDDTLFVSHSVTAPWYFTTARVGKTIPRRRSILVLEAFRGGMSAASVSCWFTLQRKHPAAEFSAMFVPLNAGGNGASNLVSGLPVKLQFPPYEMKIYVIAEVRLPKRSDSLKTQGRNL